MFIWSIILFIVPFFIFNEDDLNNRLAYLILLTIPFSPIKLLLFLRKEETEEYEYNIRKNKILLKRHDGVILSLKKEHMKNVAQSEQKKFVFHKNSLLSMHLTQSYPKLPIPPKIQKIEKIFFLIFSIVYYLAFLLYNTLMLHKII